MEQTVKRLTGRRVFIYVVLFFGVITAVNAVFITKALKSNSGIVSENPYQRGLGYNKIIEQHEKEKALGWKGMTAVENQSKLVYVLTDKNSKPIRGADISVEMVRPVNQGNDYTLSLREDLPGRYISDLNAPLKGAWEARIFAKRGEDRFTDVAPLVLE